MVEHFFLTTKLGIYSCHLIKVVAFNCCGVFYLCKMKTLSTMRPMETDQKTFHWMGRLYDATLSWWNVVQSSCQEMKYRRWPRIGLPILSYAWSILLLLVKISKLREDEFTFALTIPWDSSSDMIFEESSSVNHEKSDLHSSQVPKIKQIMPQENNI